MPSGRALMAARRRSVTSEMRQRAHHPAPPTQSTRIEVTGTLNHARAGVLYDDILDIVTHARSERIVIDMQRVTAADSNALGMLVLSQRAAAAAGTALAVINPSLLMWQVLWASGLCGLFGLATDLPR